MIDSCPNCGNGNLAESCGGGRWLYRVTFCNCGWDNLDASIREDRARSLAQWSRAPEEILAKELGIPLDILREGKRNLADPEHEKKFIAEQRERMNPKPVPVPVPSEFDHVIAFLRAKAASHRECRLKAIEVGNLTSAHVFETLAYEIAIIADDIQAGHHRPC